MTPTCYICYEQEINYNSKCSTCKKSICSNSYDKIIKRTDKEMYEYKCPFCTVYDLKEISRLEPKQIINLCNKSNDKSNIQKYIIDELRAFNNLVLSRNTELKSSNQESQNKLDSTVNEKYEAIKELEK